MLDSFFDGWGFKAFLVVGGALIVSQIVGVWIDAGRFVFENWGLVYR